MKSTLWAVIFGLILVLSSTLALAAPEIYINELLAVNDDFEIDDKTPDWFELYNAEDQPMDLSGMYLSDKANNPTKYEIPNNVIIPAESFLIFIADDNEEDGPLHTNFKLSSNGELITLYDTDGTTLIDNIEFGPQQPDISFGRIPDGTNHWNLLIEPTPGEANVFTEIIEPPTFNHDAGFHDESITLELTTGDDNTIFYTTDGSLPTVSEQNLYTEPIEIEDTTAIRAMTVSGDAQSEVISKTFLIDEDYTLPVVTFIADPIDLYTKETGLLAEFSSKANKQFHTLEMEYYNQEKELAFAMTVDGKRHSHNPGYPELFQSPFRIYAKEKYGQDRIEYPLFGEDSLESYKRIIVRNAGQDGVPQSARSVHMRDPFIHSLVDDLDMDTQASSPVIVFINGEYWGIYYLRERHDKYFLADHYDLDPEEVMVVDGKTGSEYDWGLASEEDYQNYLKFQDDHFAIWQFGQDNGFETSEFIDFIATKYDISNMFDYYATQIYISNDDWPNVRYWKPKEGGVWRWMLHDTDMSMGKHSGNPSIELFKTPAMENNFAEFLTVQELYPSPVPIGDVLRNSALQEQFIIRFADLLNTHFHTDIVTPQIDVFENRLEPEIFQHFNRWATYPSSDEESYLNIWKKRINVIRGFAEQRPDYLRTHIIEYFEEPTGTADVTITTPTCGGNVLVNTLQMQDTEFSGVYFTGLPIAITTTPEENLRVTINGVETPTHYETLQQDKDFNIKIESQVRNGKALQYLQQWETSGDVAITAGTNGNHGFGLHPGGEMKQTVSLLCESKLANNGIMRYGLQAKYKMNHPDVKGIFTLSLLDKNNNILSDNAVEVSYTKDWKTATIPLSKVPKGTENIKVSIKETGTNTFATSFFIIDDIVLTKRNVHLQRPTRDRTLVWNNEKINSMQEKITDTSKTRLQREYRRPTRTNR